jgi:hypothetical protein
MNPTYEVTFCGRKFTAQEVELMRVVAHDYAGLGVTEIARTVCELVEWKRPNGRLKNHECRQLLERLQAEGVVTLPALRKTKGKGPSAWIYPSHTSSLSQSNVRHGNANLWS